MKTDLNNLITCICGIVLDTNNLNIEIKDKNENTPDEFFYRCPLCKNIIDIE